MLTASETTESRRTSPGRRLPYAPGLDGVRALAVAGVVLYHGGVSWVPGGFLGVDVFFVLSGFLITSLLLAERRETGRIDLRRFWIRRARRLLPAAILVIAASVVAVAVIAPGDLGRTRADAITSLLYVNNWHQILADQSYFVAFERPSLLQHLWSLAIEEQFYVLWPFALGFALTRLGKRGAVVVTLGAAAGSALLMAIVFTPGDDPSRVYYGTDTHAAGLLVGALLAFAWPLGRMRTPGRRSATAVIDAAAVVGLLAVLLAMTTWEDYDAWVYHGGLVTVAIFTAVLVAGVSHPASRAGRWLGAQPLRWLGRRSYGIYLWHWPVMTLTRPQLDVDVWHPILLLGQIGVTLALAEASYRWVEQPLRTGTGQRAIRGWLDRRPPRLRLGTVAGCLLAILLPAGWVASRDVPVHAAPLVELSSAAARSTPDKAPEKAAEETPPDDTGAGENPGDQGGPAPDRPTRAEREAARLARMRPLSVGASVMLAAERHLGRRTTVDAAVGRQVGDILGRLQGYRDAGTLPSRVIVQIGENGPIDAGDIAALRHILRDATRVVLVNVRVPTSWGADSNAVLTQAVRDWPEARVADWYRVSANAALLYPDHTHPNAEGQQAYTKLVMRTLQEP